MAEAALDLHPVTAQNKERAARLGVYHTPAATTVRCKVFGETVFFVVDNPQDYIQQHHLRGMFYEADELRMMERYFPTGGRFLDIGANIGNHALYLGLFRKASYIKVLEPSARAITLLEANVYMNGLERVCDLSDLGIGLSDGTSDVARLNYRSAHNLGMTQLIEGDGRVALKTADEIIGDQAFDLIKIDVEGMELKVLAGMRRYLAHNPTPIFVEVNLEHREAFKAWLDENSYEIAMSSQRYRENRNFMIVPAGN